MADLQLRVVVAGLERYAEGRIKRLTLDVTAELVETTPRDTGWAANNWIPRIGEPLDEPAGSRDSVSQASSARQTGEVSVAAEWNLRRGPIFVSNNVPYIQKLNEGHSPQAPAGFVEAAILRGIRKGQ